MRLIALHINVESLDTKNKRSFSSAYYTLQENHRHYSGHRTRFVYTNIPYTVESYSRKRTKKVKCHKCKVNYPLYASRAQRSIIFLEVRVMKN